MDVELLSEVPFILFYNTDTHFKNCSCCSLLASHQPVFLSYKARWTADGNHFVWTGGKPELVEFSVSCITTWIADQFSYLCPCLLSHCLNLHLECCCIYVYYKLRGVLCLTVTFVALTAIVIFHSCLQNNIKCGIKCLEKWMLSFWVHFNGLSKTVFM